MKLYEDGNLKIEKEKNLDKGIIKIKESNKTYLFLIQHFNDEDIKRYIDHNTFEERIKNDEDLPLKLRHTQKIDISIAAELEDENTIKVANKNNRIIFSYLPTKANYNLPFMVNSFFTLDSSRTHLHENVYLNKLIIGSILPRCLFLFINNIGSCSIKNQFILNLIPNNIEIPKTMKEDFLIKLKLEVFEKEIFPNIQNKMNSARNLIIDKINFFPLTKYDKSYFNKSIFMKFLIEKNKKFNLDEYSIIKPEVELLRDDEYTKSINDDCFNFFKFTAEIICDYPKYSDKCYKKNEEKIDENIKFLKLLYAYFLKENENFEEIIPAIKKFELFYDNETKLRKIEELVIPNPYLSNILLNKISINNNIANYIRNQYINERESFIEFINEIGIIYLNDEIITEYIFTNIFYSSSNKQITINIDSYVLYLSFFI